MALEPTPNDRRYYPLYAECVELGIPFCTQMGHTGPLRPSDKPDRISATRGNEGAGQRTTGPEPFGRVKNSGGLSNLHRT